MNKNLYYCLTLLVTCFVFAQKPQIKISNHIPPDEAKSRKNKNSDFFHSSRSEFMVSDRTKKGSVITVYNSSTLKKNSTFTLNYPEVKGKNANWVKRLIHDENITSIYAYYDKKEDENTIYGKITDRKNKNIVKEKILLKTSAKKKKNIGSQEVHLSPDNSKILIIRIPASKSFENEKVEMVMYDRNLDKIFEKELNFPYKNKSFSIEQILVTNNGNVSIIAFWSPSKNEIKDDPDLKEQMTFKLFKVTEDDKNLEEIEINEKAYSLSSCRGIISNDSLNEIVYFGFYREIKKGQKKRFKFSINGIYYIKLDVNKWEISSIKFNILDENTITKILVSNSESKRTEKRAKKAAQKGLGISRMAIKGVHYDKEGSINVVGQIEYIREVCSTNPKTGVTTCQYYYHNNQIILFQLDNLGELKQTIVVPKEQIVLNFSAWNGHILLLNENNVNFIYNDHDFNFNTKKISKKNRNQYSFIFSGRKKSRLAIVSTDEKGKLKKQPMVDSWKQNVLIYPSEYIRINNSAIVTWGKIRKSKEFVLYKIFFND
jgi:hypothetical protein